jgi:diguanylate cyclase (GGDEF)-like protein/PAS domain S-box-containing protein
MGFAKSVKQRFDAARRSLSDGRDKRAGMAAALFLLFAAGAIIGLAAIPLSVGLSGREKLAEVAICGLAVGACLVIARRWRRLSNLGFQLFLFLGTAVITAGTYFASSGPTDTEMFYIWVALYAAYFFTRRQALLQLAFVGIGYATVLALGKTPGEEPARWLITMGSVIVTTVLFGYIKELLDRRLAERERSERELERSLSLQHATLESTADGILVVDRDGRIVSFNQRFKEMWRIPQEIMEAGNDDRALAFVSDQLIEPESFVRKVDQLYRRPEAESRDMLRFKDGRAMERYSRPQRGVDGEIHGRVWSFRDVTERERIQERLRYLADHDPLTGLPNRRRFEEELGDRVAQAGRYGQGGAVLLLDIDNFKDINDSLGHHTGDAVIRSIADLLRDQIRDTDVLARLGGDELAVLLPHADLARATHVAKKLLDTVREHRAVFRGKRLRLTTSIGCAVISSSDVQTAEQLMMEADVAVYEAKDAGRDRLCVYAPSASRASEAQNSLAWTDRIRGALDGDGLTLFAQPILDLARDEVSQYELLVRMAGPNGELLPPDAFLPNAERSGMINEIDAWVTRNAIRLIERHRQAGHRLQVEVNLSGRTLGDLALPRLIAEELEATSVDPANLIFEVTETAAVLNMEEAREFASAVTRLGCRFALDDFGAGFGSFYYLKYLPLEFLKIDGDFIGSLGHNRTDQVVVKAIVELSQRLGKATIAEFVENARTLELLRDFGIDYVQGYHIGMPRPINEIEPRVDEGTAVSDLELDGAVRASADQAQPSPPGAIASIQSQGLPHSREASLDRK